MVKKEMNFITHSFKGLLSDIQPKMVVVTKFMDGLNELEGLIEEPERTESENDRPTMVIDSTGQIKEQEDDGPLAFIKKGFSFF